MLRKKENISIRKITGKFLILVGAFIIIMTIVFDIWFRPVIERMFEYRCKLIADRAVSRAITEHLNTTDEDYSDIISFVYDSEGRIGALRTNPPKINTMKAAVMEKVNSELSTIKAEKVGITIGTLSGVSYLYGVGNEIMFTVKPVGVARSRLYSKFESSGINQTMHSVILEIDTEVSPLIPGVTETFLVTTEFIIAQTVIVGDIPDSYSNIILDEQHYSELADFDIS